MGRYTGPKHRLARQEGINVLEKTSASLARRLTVPPGVHGPRGKRKQSEFAVQLREKQRAKKIYGLYEKQFRLYYQEAARIKGKTGEALLATLERRLDNSLFRLGFVPSRNMGRQLVSHGHVLVDNKKINIPSYLLRINQVITLDAKALEIPAVKKMLTMTEQSVPAYFEKEAAAGRLTKIPGREEIPTEINEQLIIEYYSR